MSSTCQGFPVDHNTRIRVPIFCGINPQPTLTDDVNQKPARAKCAFLGIQISNIYQPHNISGTSNRGGEYYPLASHTRAGHVDRFPPSPE
jgi:hypothetical protein